ncbi:MAG: sulfurtransferase [Desulfobulbaceae bacterium]|nr:sulfurtransferase [Desulfobulbaceae bacterium]
MTEKILYTPPELHALLAGSGATVIDIRPPAAYRQAHLPGAVNIHEVFTYLLPDSSPQGLAGMAATFTGLFAAAGVRHERPAIFYDDTIASQYGGACRGYWLLSYLGHPAAGLLAGGFSGWQENGLPVAAAVSQPPAGDFVAAPHPALLATTEEVLAALDNPDVILLDNRDEPEWLGLSSSPYGKDFAPRKGKIPGARWIEWHAFMDDTPHPAFKPAAKILALCDKHGIMPTSDIIIYCFKGARAAHTYVALKLAGFHKLRIYFGSWNEWSRNPELPIS